MKEQNDVARQGNWILHLAGSDVPLAMGQQTFPSSRLLPYELSPYLREVLHILKSLRDRFQPYSTRKDSRTCHESGWLTKEEASHQVELLQPQFTE